MLIIARDGFRVGLEGRCVIMFPIPPIFIFIVISFLAGFRVGRAGPKVLGICDNEKIGASDPIDEGLWESRFNLEGELLMVPTGLIEGGSLRPVTV